MTIPSDLLPVAILDEKTGTVSQSFKSPAVWDGKAEVDRHFPSSSLTPQPPAPTRSTFASICIVAACTSAELTSIGLCPAYAISVPYAGKDLHIQKENLQWIQRACFLLFERLADLYGRKRVWLVGYLILWCSVLDLASLDLGIMAKAFPPGTSRPLAFATFSAGAPIGATVAIVLCGVLTQVTKAAWRTPRFLLSGVALAFTVLGFFVFEDEPSTEEDKRVDWIGAFLVTVGLVCSDRFCSERFAERAQRLEEFTWAFLQERRRSFHIHPDLTMCADLIAVFVVSVVLVLLFVAWQYYLERRLENPDHPHTRWTAPPLMKPSMWTRANGRFAVMQIIACINWAAFTIWLVWVELYN
ncbi:hypothetical protein H4582DRAFT_2082209 [Lactarius indigo]|nr:hypothetical protein H4582DRAFT_2082209 [Lactarius indigo]